MFNRARWSYEREMLHAHVGAELGVDRPLDNRLNPINPMPRVPAYTVRETNRGYCLDITS